MIFITPPTAARLICGLVPSVPTSELTVLMTLIAIGYLKNTDVVSASHNEIQAQCGFSKPTIGKSLKALAELDLILVTPNYGKEPAIYEINWPAISAIALPETQPTRIRIRSSNTLPA